jgi:hypothetical protein
MDQTGVASEAIPYAATRAYPGGIQPYVGPVMFCDLIGSMVTPDIADMLEARLVAEASVAAGQEAHIVEIVPYVDMGFGQVLKVLFEPVSAGRPAVHLRDALEQNAGDNSQDSHEPA